MRPISQHQAAGKAIGCDAIYIAVASSRGETLVTLDRQQLEPAAAVTDVQQP